MAATMPSTSVRAVLIAARTGDLYSDGNRWWDERAQVRLPITAVSWCRGAELVERAPAHPLRPWRIFQLTDAGRVWLDAHPVKETA